LIFINLLFSVAFIPCCEKHYSNLVDQNILISFLFFSPRFHLGEKSCTRFNILINAVWNYYFIFIFIASKNNKGRQSNYNN
jgi:hypothetical protein